MFLQRDITPQDLERFHAGFMYYWDVFSALDPSLNNLVDDICRDPMVVEEYKRYGVGEEQLIFHAVKSVTLLIYVMGEENASQLVGDYATQTFCAMVPMIADPQNLDPKGRMAEYNIAATIISTILLRQAYQCSRNPQLFIDEALRELQLPGRIHQMLQSHFKKSLKDYSPAFLTH